MTLRARPSILFVSDTAAADLHGDPSVRYRCFNVSQELVRRGFRSHVIALSVFEQQRRELRGFDRYILHRPRLSEPLAEFVLALSRDRCVADLDELSFDVARAESMPAVRLRQRPAEEVRHDFASQSESMRLVERAAVSTVALAAHARHFENLTVSIVHSHLDPAFLGLARLLRELRPRPARPFALGYFADGAGHDLDLELIAPTLVHALRADRTARLLVAGPVALPQELTPFLPQIRQVGVLPLHALPHAMSQCQKVIAPLEPTTFNECSSALACVEAALVGCEVVATPTPDIDRFQSPLLSTCTTSDEWSEGLLADHGLGPADIERHARELEHAVQIDAALPGWLRAVGLEAQ
jgi:hypothetical protein